MWTLGDRKNKGKGKGITEERRRGVKEIGGVSFVPRRARNKLVAASGLLPP